MKDVYDFIEQPDWDNVSTPEMVDEMPHMPRMPHKQRDALLPDPDKKDQRGITLRVAYERMGRFA